MSRFLFPFGSLTVSPSESIKWQFTYVANTHVHVWVSECMYLMSMCTYFVTVLTLCLFSFLLLYYGLALSMLIGAVFFFLLSLDTRYEIRDPVIRYDFRFDNNSSYKLFIVASRWFSKSIKTQNVFFLKPFVFVLCLFLQCSCSQLFHLLRHFFFLKPNLRYKID